MSAETLRRAAALMRERAEAATSSPWRVESRVNARIVGNTETVASGTTPIADCWGRPAPWRKPDADHIASWHPAVALAVADWLDDHAETAELFVAKEIPASAWSMNWQTSHNHALAVANAYLDQERP